jgi:PKD repeat protein
MASPLFSGETLIKIAEDANMSYFKPEVKIAPNGDIYIVYRARNLNSGRSEIYLGKYSTGGKVSFVKNLSESGALSYEPEIDIRGNGDIHVAWCDQSGDIHTIKYRYFNGSNWSGIRTFGQVEGENIEDLRIAVDESGNVFVVFMWWPAAKCKLITKYGNNVSFEDFPERGRSKHPDVEADGNYVHIVWQYKPGSEYTIAYQRRPNRAGSNWERWVDLEFYGTQRPRMSLDSSNTPHVVFFRNLGSTRKLWYKKWNGSTFDDLRVMSDPNNFETYHFCDISAVNGDNILVSMQKGGWSGGRNVSYNWKKNGDWSGFSFFAKSVGPRPTKQSIDLAKDRFYAAVAFADRDDRVYLLLAEEEGSPGGNAPTANFTFSPQDGHAPLAVTFDGSGSTDPDGNITAYRWNFGDGITGSGQVVTHTFANEGEYIITLTVTDNDGKSGSTSHTIYVEPPNVPPFAAFTLSPVSGLYPLTVTFDASASSDSDGYIAQWEWDFGGEQTGSGQVVAHTFPEEGLQIIILTVYDDDGDSASATGTVEVLGLLSPLNITFEAKTNRNLFTIQHVYHLTWNRNPGNADRGANIVQYNIYRKRPGESDYSFLASVAAQENNEYFDRLGEQKEDFQYTVTAVDDQGRESKIGAATGQARLPVNNMLPSK